MCKSLEDVLQVVESMKSICELPFYSKAATSFLKLELLDEKIKPSDIGTKKILLQLPCEIREICIPYLSGDLDLLKYAVDIGCPCVRIWCSEIGRGQGITDTKRLSTIVKSTNAPLILEGGIVSPDHAKLAMEIGFKAVLVNSAFRLSREPVDLARKFRVAIDSVRPTKYI
jgi:thiazole synthase